MFFFLSSLAQSAFVQAHEERAFLAWMKEHNQMFVGEEYSFRLGVFLSNKRYISEFNKAGNRKFTLGVNRFAAMTQSEYKAFLTKPRSVHEKKTIKSQPFVPKLKDLPDEVDWRTKGVLNEVRDQGWCASGWAFACCAAMEANWAIYHNDLYVLSPQNFLDCVWSCEGCDGGSSDAAADWAINEQEGQFNLESDYPYEMDTMGNCRYKADKGVTKLASITLAMFDEETAKKLCAEVGPLSAEFDASLLTFEYYSGGVYDDENCSEWGICHSLAIVGYGVYEGEDYWLIRNSYGKQWGLDGYGMVKRNGGHCGIDFSPFALNVA